MADPPTVISGQAALANPDAEIAPRERLVVVDGFLPVELATAMREDIDRHFTGQHANNPNTHQIWNYLFAPQLSAYMQTSPEKIIDGERITLFCNALKAWSIGTLGMGRVTRPQLDFHSAGCSQGFCNEPRNGRFAFVYSLTRDARRTVGGDTLVMREGDPFRAHLTTPATQHGFCDIVEPRFNRLLIFDDRLMHAVSRLEGSMDPVEGRFVLCGHLSEAGPMIGGALPPDAVTRPIDFLLNTFAIDAAARIALHRGVLSIRLLIDPSGSVAACDVLNDRVIHPDPDDVEWEHLREDLVERFRMLKFSPATSETVVIQPIVFGGALPLLV
ncbi:MAG TPA: hypothetical protein VGR70_05315 [Stellaceae bacterium]|nr:hypothetical protein [Stellaceae bacterium]